MRGDTGVIQQSASLDGRKVILAVSGGIAATESIKLARELRRHGATVFPMMTKSAEKIISPLALSWGSQADVMSDWEPEMSHLGGFDGLVLAPATRNTIAKFIHGFLDSPLMMALSAAAGSGMPLMFVPSMHNDLFHDPVTSELIDSLDDKGVRSLVDSPKEGKRKQPSAVSIVAEFCNFLNSRLNGRKKIAVTLGGNSAPIDSVRSIVNYSSGNSGWRIAEHLHRMGHDVICIAGRTTSKPSFQLPDVRFDESHKGMLLNSVQLANSSEKPDYWIHAAAVLDYAPEFTPGKTPSNEENWKISLFPTKKHLAELDTHVSAAKRIAFKLEVDSNIGALIEKSQILISKHNLEAVVANLLGEVVDDSSTRCRIVSSDGSIVEISDLSELCNTIEGIISSN